MQEIPPLTINLFTIRRAKSRPKELPPSVTEPSQPGSRHYKRPMSGYSNNKLTTFTSAKIQIKTPPEPPKQYLPLKPPIETPLLVSLPVDGFGEKQGEG